MIKRSHYDLVIIGGGVAGTTAAISALQQARKLNTHRLLSVLVVEATDGSKERIGESVLPDIMVSLSQLGLDKKFHDSVHQPCPGNISVWGHEEPSYLDFLSHPMGNGWRLNRAIFDRMLMKTAIMEGAEFCWNTRFLKIDKQNNGTGYQLNLGHTDLQQTAHLSIHAQFVIDASGAQARFATELGVQRKVHDELFALARFSTVESGELTMQTHIEATEFGWWYTAQLLDRRVICMFVSDAETFQNIREQGYQKWYDFYEQTQFIKSTLNKLQLGHSDFHGFPISSSLLDKVAGYDWVAVGDAAASYDPIVSQGIYKAMRDGVYAGRYFIEQQTKPSFEDSIHYGQKTQRQFIEYNQHRQYLYQLEQRWADARFWQNRWVSYE